MNPILRSQTRLSTLVFASSSDHDVHCIVDSVTSLVPPGLILPGTPMDYIQTLLSSGCHSLSHTVLSSVLLLPTLTNGYLPTSPDSEFDAQVDWSAFVSFSIIMMTSLWLIRRTSEVEQAVQERETALLQLRTWKSQQLVNGSGTNSVDRGEKNNDDTATVQVQNALKQYERAVQKEENLRNLVPGGWIRIVPPNAVGKAYDRNAKEVARMFLGKEYDIGGASGNEDRRVQTVEGTEKDSRNVRLPTASHQRLPLLAQGLLAVMAISLTGLLIFLTLDPVTMSTVLKDL